MDGWDRRLRLLDALRLDTTQKRTRQCRRDPIGAGGRLREADPAFRRAMREDGSAAVYVSGVQTCGHITCPCCGATIRRRERDRMQALAAAHLDAGGALYTSTLTLSHGPHDDPSAVLDALYAGRSRAIGSDAGGAWAKDRRTFGIAGVSWHLDPPPIGRNGVHWHLHLLWFVDGELGDDELAALNERVHGRYLRGLDGRRALASFNRIERVRCAEAAAAYCSKGDGGAARIAAEVADGDGKSAAGVLPLDLLDAFERTGDAGWLGAFLAYERAMAGRTWRFTPPAILRRHGIEATTDAEDADEPEAQAAAVLADQEDATEEIRGAVVIRPEPHEWQALRRRRGAIRAVRRLLLVYADDEARAYIAGVVADTVAG